MQFIQAFFTAALLATTALGAAIPQGTADAATAQVDKRGRIVDWLERHRHGKGPENDPYKYEELDDF